MGSTQRLLLVIDTSFGTLRFGDANQVFLHFLSEVADYECDFINGFVANLGDVFHQMLHDWLACHWNQWLWNREGVRPHPFSHPSHWHYYLHKQLVKVVAKVQKTKFKTLIMGI